MQTREDRKKRDQPKQKTENRENTKSSMLYTCIIIYHAGESIVLNVHCTYTQCVFAQFKYFPQ